MPPASLVGRDADLALLAGLVRDVARGGSCLLLRGEPGVGKSALLDAAAAQAVAGGCVVLRVTGVGPEAQVPWSGLHRLLRPVLADADALPVRLRDALLSAFGLAEPAAEPSLVGYAALELLTERATLAPVVLVVDDVQWLDAASAAALAFVARRVEDEPVVVLAAVRDGAGTPATDAAAAPFTDGTLPELVVPPLGPSDACQVLDRHALDLPVDVRRRILELAAGNPLALVELPRAWAHTGAGHLGDGPLTARLDGAFARALRALPPEVRDACLVVAADDGDDATEAARAMEALTGTGRGDGLLAAAVAGGVLVLDGPRVRFRHPLVRSACYDGASVDRRRAAHAALAAVLVDQPARRTWHRAAARTGPAEDVAADLETAADHAVRQGVTSVAVAALARAADLSSTSTARGRRLTAAAGLAYRAGERTRGEELLRAASACALTEEDRLRVSWLTEWFGDPTWSGAAKVRALCDVAARLSAQGQRDQAGAMLLDVALRCWWSNPDDATTQVLVRTVEGLGPPGDAPAVLGALACGAPDSHGRLVTERLAALRPETLEQPADVLVLGTAATAVGAFPLAAALLSEAVSRLRARGDLVGLLRALVSQVLTDFHLGRWDAARTAAAEVRRLADDTAQPLWGAAGAAVETLVLAGQGDHDALQEQGRAVDTFLLALGAPTFMAPVELARAHAALARGRHDEALQHVRRVADAAGPVHHRYARHWGTLDHVEAAAAVGLLDEALEVVASAGALHAATGSPLLGAHLQVARAVVAPDAEADALFRAGLTPELARWPHLHARHLLAHGTWLRRRRRVRDARAALRAARDLFDALGAVDWYARAAHELRAAGEPSRERVPGVAQRLSPQERQIAELAATGLTNREIGRHLYLSHRTVGTHLYRIFPKLGVTSRAQLAAVLRQDGPTGGATR